VVELELLERAEDTVALLGERELLPLERARVVEPVVGGSGLAQEGAGDEEDDGDGEEGGEYERRRHAVRTPLSA
jgi:hypothetical protein